MKYLRILFLLVIALSIPGSVRAEVIRSFDAVVMINEDRTLTVEERIVYDFEDEIEKRGIFREIPLRGIRVNLGEVLQNSEEAVIQESREGGNLRVRIGEEDVFVEGAQEYTIRYDVRGVFERIESESIDEVFWQVTGTEWSVPIERASVRIEFPEDLSENRDFQFACYVGDITSTSQLCEDNWVPNEQIYVASVNEELRPGEGFTFAAGMPYGVVSDPGFFEQYRTIIDIFVAVILLAGAVPIILSAYFKYARDPKLRRPFPVQYDAPEGMAPAGVHRMKHKVQSTSEIVATMISLAEKGFLKIEETQEKGVFKKQIFTFYDQGKDQSELREFEVLLLKKLFQGTSQVDTKELEKNHFGDRLTQVYSKIYEEEIGTKNYYTRPPMGSSAAVVGVGFMIGLVIIPFAIASMIYSVVSVLLIVVGVWILAAYMPQRTEEGTRVLEYLLGFERYIDVAEKHRFEFQEKEHIFFDILPYAIALGKAKVWAKAFEGIVTESPDWYSSSSNQVFSSMAFADTMSTGLQASSVSNTSASSGGGSVGGGSGGGGGGSW